MDDARADLARYYARRAEFYRLRDATKYCHYVQKSEECGCLQKGPDFALSAPNAVFRYDGYTPRILQSPRRSILASDRRLCLLFTGSTDDEIALCRARIEADPGEKQRTEWLQARIAFLTQKREEWRRESNLLPLEDSRPRLTDDVQEYMQVLGYRRDFSEAMALAEAYAREQKVSHLLRCLCLIKGGEGSTDTAEKLAAVIHGEMQLLQRAK